MSSSGNSKREGVGNGPAPWTLGRAWAWIWERPSLFLLPWVIWQSSTLQDVKEDVAVLNERLPRPVHLIIGDLTDDLGQSNGKLANRVTALEVRVDHLEALHPNPRTPDD